VNVLQEKPPREYDETLFQIRKIFKRAIAPRLGVILRQTPYWGATDIAQICGWF
jgi:hypothetical protein